MVFESFLLKKQIEDNLMRQFDIECPPKAEEDNILTGADAILSEFHKWIEFWYQRRPVLEFTDIKPNKKVFQVLHIKMSICDEQIVGYLQQLSDLGLKDMYFARYH